MTPHEPNEPSSPPCSMDEYAADLLPPPDWSGVRALRKAKRAELLEHRAALSFHDRQHYAESLTAHLLTAVDLDAFPVLGFYWPIRGELDLRDFARRHVEAGHIAALPVVVTKNAPVEFWRWQPGESLRRGLSARLRRRLLRPHARGA